MIRESEYEKLAAKVAGAYRNKRLTAKAIGLTSAETMRIRRLMEKKKYKGELFFFLIEEIFEEAFERLQYYIHGIESDAPVQFVVDGNDIRDFHYDLVHNDLEEEYKIDWLLVCLRHMFPKYFKAVGLCCRLHLESIDKNEFLNEYIEVQKNLYEASGMNEKLG